MSLFQHSVLNKYLKEASQEEMKIAYQKLVTYFHNPTIQENIRERKEEQFQEGFLSALFVNVLGYTLSPNPDFNLTTEFKNERGAKKADGAILVEGSAIGVIELKSTKTKDLEAIRLQAFDYKANQQKCVYVITSNFEKVRFYINNAVEFEEFDLFRLEYVHFQLLWLCLAKENLLNGIPLVIKEDSILKEENITKKIYVDYSLFKHDLYNDLIKNNLAIEIFNGKDEKEIKLTLFQKSQKLLDRFLFVFFGEDRGLLPPNSISKIIDKWNKDTDWGESKTLYSIYKQYFNFLNVGRPSRGEQAEIFSYNGGLFKPDEILDSITISNDVFKKHTEILSRYDFESEVDVNILGHIFENSLNEIEEITAQIEGTAADLKKSKRKKDGVFYTPKYITKYIVENTVGKLCDEKKTELEIEENEYLKSRKGRTTKKLKELDSRLDNYRNWLLTLTICDPACGSGAFLNQALDFLIREHRYIDELKAKLLDVPMIFTEVENSILEKNIFGVDINEESVEIAKLSLWLRTAQKGRKLTTLSNNIKCGNSLIDDPEIAEVKAFNWQTEFPEVFKNGGFDVVIGNPPYGASLNQKEKNYFKESYKVTEYNFDTYNFFFELSVNILKKGCYLGFITPNTFLVVENGVLLRRLLFKENRIIELYETFNVFPDAVVEPINIILRKIPSQEGDKLKVLTEGRKTGEVASQMFLHEYILSRDSLIFNYRETNKERELYLKTKSSSKPLSSFAKVTTGIKPYQVGKGIPKQTNEIVKNKPFTSFENNEGWNPLVRGTQINRYLTKWDGEFLNYGEWLAEPRKTEIFFEPKLFIRRTDDTLLCSYDDKKFIGVNSIHCIQSLNNEIDNKYLLALINSKLCNWFFRHENFHMVGKPLAEVKVIYVERLPIIKVNFEYQQIFIGKVNQMLSLNLILHNKKSNFIKYIQSLTNDETVSSKLQNWNELEFRDFINEINKTIKSAVGGKLSKTQEMEWMEVFENKKAEAQILKAEIEKTDREIDRMVYELYGLTEEEIKIVEGTV